ncbi:MAG TPA: S49 family peptidase [Casimicrobiaceae bacterium]|jgi:protease-4|nr:S49 family peptidase [Casimicrobiaceae bacterium]
MADEGWERRALETLANDIVVERRRARRWSIFFRLLTLAVIVVGALALFGLAGTRGQLCIDKCTAVVHLEGEIDREGRASAENIIQGLHAAFEHPGTKGVLLRINSPGGSPVQAGQIFAEMRRLRAKYPKIPLHAVIEDMAASGGYYVAAAADRIYVDPASLVGSIGVLIDSFGFVGTLEKLGVERRVLAAGENKTFLDPFLPLKEPQREYAQTMLDDIHQQFIGAVRDGRGPRLKESPDMFSGLVWNGQRAVDLGLADAFGSVDSVARDVIGAEEVVDFTPKEDLGSRLARRFGAEAGRTAIGALRSGALSVPALR